MIFLMYRVPCARIIHDGRIRKRITNNRRVREILLLKQYANAGIFIEYNQK